MGGLLSAAQDNQAVFLLVGQVGQCLLLRRAEEAVGYLAMRQNQIYPRTVPAAQDNQAGFLLVGEAVFLFVGQVVRLEISRQEVCVSVCA